MTERRQFPKFNCDLFETNGYDDASAVMHMFDKKNRRVNRIFADDTEEEVEIEKSYGLHLVSRRDSNSDKENTKKSASQVRALSPVDIVVASSEDISDPKTTQTFKEPPPSIAKSTRVANISLRRSLFQQGNGKSTAVPSEKDLVCSTPITQRNSSPQKNFFDGTGSEIDNLSPIRKNSALTSSTQNLNGDNAKAPRPSLVIEKIASLAEFEDDLMEQYQMDVERTPSRKSRCKSRASNKSASSSQPTPMATDRDAVNLREVSVQLQPMELSEDIISNYRQSRIRTLSLSNQTDVNSINIVETPLTRRQQTAHCDSVLARKLQQCESDSEMTDDEESGKVIPTTLKSNKKASVTSSDRRSLRNSQQQSQKKLSCIPISKSRNEISITDDDNNEEEEEEEDSNQKSSESNYQTPQRAQNNAQLNDSSNDDDDTGGNEEENENASEEGRTSVTPETVVFKKPTSMVNVARKSRMRSSQIITTNTSIEAAQVSQCVVDSLVSLRKTSNESSVLSQTQQNQSSRRFSMPKRSKRAQKTSPVIPDYLKASKKSKKAKEDRNSKNKKKRTLYTQNSICEEENDNQSAESNEQVLLSPESRKDQSLAESDHDIRVTLDQIRQSLDSVSNASSEFNAEIHVEPPRKRGRPKKAAKQVTATEQNPKPAKRQKRIEISDNAEATSNDDEGFASDDNYQNVKYDPNKNGCVRKGLRIRRYPTAWWRHDAGANDYGLVYRCYTKEDYRNEVKNRRKSNVVFGQTRTVGSRKRTSSTSTAKTTKAKRTKRALPTVDESDENQSTASSEALSTCTFRTAHSRSETIKRVFESYTSEQNDNAPSTSKMTNAYDLQQINKLEWTACGKNILYHQFVNNKNDGFIQFLPSAQKARAKTKRSILKFVLLCGKIDFYVNDVKETLEHLGYISIQPGNVYSAKNPYNDAAILTFTKLDALDESSSF